MAGLVVVGADANRCPYTVDLLNGLVNDSLQMVAVGIPKVAFARNPDIRIDTPDDPAITKFACDPGVGRGSLDHVAIVGRGAFGNAGSGSKVLAVHSQEEATVPETDPAAPPANDTEPAIDVAAFNELAQEVVALQAAADNAQPGDVFHVAAGVYSPFQMLVSGTPAQPVPWRTVRTMPASMGSRGQAPTSASTRSAASSGWCVATGGTSKGSSARSPSSHGP